MKFKHKRCVAYLLAFFLSLLLFFLYVCRCHPLRKKRVGNTPRLLRVYYHQYPGERRSTELVDFISIDKLTSSADAQAMIDRGGMPLFYTIGTGDYDLPFAYNVIDISTPERPNHYRVNIVDNLVKRTIADVEYRNEPFLVIARGRDWYLAITRRLED